MVDPYPGSANDNDSSHDPLFGDKEERLSWEDLAGNNRSTASQAGFPDYDGGRYQPSPEQARYGKFGVIESFRWAGEALRANPTPWLVVGLLNFVIGGLNSWYSLTRVETAITTMREISEAGGALPATAPVYGVGVAGAGWIITILTGIVGILTTLMFSNAAVSTLYGKKITLSEMVNFKNIGGFIAIYLVSKIVAVILLPFLVIPSIVWLIFVSFAEIAYFLLYKPGITGAFRGSFGIVKANFGSVIGMLVLLGIITAISAIFLGIPLIVVAPFTTLAIARAFQSSIGAPVYEWGKARTN